ncbi:unnamed protein product [Didymodactylos carnosus]|uniref:GrpE protein homolog n=1 Tax=Didymodactylos carnosus TaxID=1234261 RepID=A0A8S2D7V0_9BILA|nr:unnamed protein product [Didymodactylos carnosus]CAF3609434.1 unnamed protein product [Didymodactylos carnosus]
MDLEHKIEALNKDFIRRVTEKANEAQRIVDAKNKEFQDHFAEELVRAKRFASEDAATRLLEPIYNFDLAMGSLQSLPKELQNYMIGFKMVHSSFVDVLTALNVKELDVKLNQPFDPLRMDAFEETDLPSIKPGHVSEVIAKGYELHGKVIKFARVKVNSQKH